VETEEEEMKRSKRAAIIAVLILTGVALIAVPAVARNGRAARGCGAGRGMGPAFTEEQLEQIESIHDKYSDRRAELTNRLKVIMVDAHESMGEGEPDFNAIERRMEEVADIRLDLAKLRLTIHKEIRPLLDDDQKVLFDRGLGRILHGGTAGRRGQGMMDGRRGMMGGQGVPGRPGAGSRMGMEQGMGRGTGRGMHGMGHGTGMGMGQGMGRGGEMMPWCPFADDAEDDD
jgi:Spy/CpxP family protein refolding chaperone